MAYTIQIDTISNELYSFDLESPSDTSTPAIAFWLRSNLGALNNLIGTSYTLNDSGNEASPHLGLQEKDILKAMYLVYYHNRNVRANLGAAAYDAILEVSSDGASVRKVNKNEVSKTYLQLARDARDYLYKLVNAYKQSTGSTPLGIFGDDYLSSVPYTYEKGTDRKGNTVTYPE